MATTGSSRDAFSGRPRFFLRLAYQRTELDEVNNRSRWFVSLRVDNDDRVSYTYAYGQFPYQINFNGAAWVSGSTPGNTFDFSDGAAYHDIGGWYTNYISHDVNGTITFTIDAAVSGASIFGSANTPDIRVTQDANRLPDAPGSRQLDGRTATSLDFSWGAADGNGSAIIGYNAVLWNDDSLAGTAQEKFVTLDDAIRTYNFTGLKPNTPYWFGVRAQTATGYGPFTSILSARTGGVPATVATPSVSSYADTSAVIAWTAPSDNGSSIIGYDVQRSSNSAFTYGVVNFLSNSTPNHTLTGLAKGTPYWTRVRAKNDAGDGAWSTAVSFTTRDVPDTPAAPTVSSYTQDDVTIAWTAPANNGYTVTSYDIQYDTVSNFASPSTISNATGSSRNIAGLALDTLYYVRIRATNASGDSAWSAARSFRTRGVPSAPGAPTFSSITVNSVRVAWTASSDENGYAVDAVQLQRALDSGFTSGLTTYSLGDVTAYSASGLVPGEGYYWRVRSHNAAGYSAWSAVRGVTLLTGKPTQPTGLNLSGIAPKAETLTWDAPSTGNGATITGYDIQFDTVSNFASPATVAVGTGRTYTRTDLTPSTTYYWRVRAKTSITTGDWSSAVSAKTLSGGYVGSGGDFKPTEVYVGVGGTFEISEVYVGDGGDYVAAG